MPPYAASYLPPVSDDVAHATSDGPVRLYLGSGLVPDVVEHKMDCQELVPDAQEVQLAVESLRKLGPSEMDVDGERWWTDSRTEQVEGETVVVLDTNILLRYLSTLQGLVHVLNSEPCTAFVILVPHIVVSELDKLKTSTREASMQESQARMRIATLARRATNWILDNLASPSSPRSVLRGQRRDETLVDRDEFGCQAVENNDALVLDAALFHARVKGRRTYLLTEDKNLAVRAKMEDLVAFGIEDDSVEGLLAKFRPDAVDGLITYKQFGNGVGLGSTRRLSSDAARRRKEVEAFPAVHPVEAPQTDVEQPRRRNSSLSSTGGSRKPPVPYQLASAREEDTRMELEPDEPHAPLVEHDCVFAPELVPVTRPGDVFINVSRVMVAFVAARLYSLVFRKLQEIRRKEQHEWQKQLGDWRWWNAERCARVMKEYWEQGGVQQVCLSGLERQVKPSSLPKSQQDIQQITPQIRHDTTTSRWASSCSTSTAATPTNLTVRAPITSTINERLSPEKRLAKIHASLTGLAASFATEPEQTHRWSAPRWEVFLESVAEVLIALLGGFFSGGVEDVKPGH
ncbi:hypothetical protein OIV83_000857 [Microbotryomycetes sp. JL201]|nr:hypothetical protein OIV83_000857 [Microbotryomycetes sp. JL201]